MGKFEKTNRPPVRSARPYSGQSQAARAAGSGNRRKPEKSPFPLIIGILASVFVILSCVLVYIVIQSRRDDGKIAQNIFVGGVDLSGMTEEEATAALEQLKFDENMQIRLYTKGDTFSLFQSSYDPANERVYDIYGNELENAQQTVALPQKETPETDEDAPLDEDGQPYLRYSTIVLPADGVNVKLDVKAAVEEAMRYGREIGSKENTERIDLTVPQFVTLNEDYIAQFLAQTLEETYLEGTQTAWEKTTTTVTDADGNPQEVDAAKVTLGTMSRTLDTARLQEEIVSAYLSGVYDLQYVLDETYPEPFDLDKLFTELKCKEPVNAVCDPDTYEITDGTNGYGFRMSDAYVLFSDALPGDTVTLPLQELEPMHTRETLETQLFCDVLSYCDSPHVWNPNRTNNLILAAEAIDGYILKPGEVFSFNEIVGQRTAAKGYKEAGVYVGGRTEQQLGGGICQVASTLFYCTLYSNLEVVERTEHQYLPDYIPYGMDATIYWGSLDYKFRNNTAYPIRIECSVSDGKVHTRFIGTETKDYTIEMKYEITSWQNYQEVTVDIFPEMDDYDRYKDFKTGDVIQIGYSAAKVTTYMYKYDLDGNLLSKEAVFYSNYSRRNREIANVLDEEEDPSTDPSTDPTEDPSTEPSTDPSTEPPTESTEPSTQPPTESTEPPTQSPEPADPPAESSETP